MELYLGHRLTHVVRTLAARGCLLLGNGVSRPLSSDRLLGGTSPLYLICECVQNHWCDDWSSLFPDVRIRPSTSELSGAHVSRGIPEQGRGGGGADLQGSVFM